MGLENRCTVLPDLPGWLGIIMVFAGGGQRLKRGRESALLNGIVRGVSDRGHVTAECKSRGPSKWRKTALQLAASLSRCQNENIPLITVDHGPPDAAV